MSRRIGGWSLALVVVAVLVATLVGLARGERAAPSQNAKASQPVPAAALTAGGTAFVRVKQYSTLSGKPVMEDSAGGTAYVLKNFCPAGIGIEIAKPTATDATFSFGETVTLVERKDGPPAMWLVATGQTRVQLPEYLLTASKAEIDFLVKIDRVPEAMAFFYKGDGHFKVWGVYMGGPDRCLAWDSHGTVLMDSPSGTSPFALKGNAVVVDESVVKETWEKPLVFDGSKKPFQLSSSFMYYCISGGNNPAFESIDLKHLKSTAPAPLR